MSRSEKCDVIIVGAGSAAFEAAVACRQAGAEKVVMLEKAPEDEFGGNARFSHTGFRFVYSGKDEIREFVTDVDDETYSRFEIPPYTADDFMADLNRVTEGRIDQELAQYLVDQSNEAVHWMRETGVPWEHQKYVTVGDRCYFEPGVVIHTVGGGQGQLLRWREIATGLNVVIRYDSRVVAFLGDHRAVAGVRVCHDDDGYYELTAPAVIVCSGGFQANTEMRARYLGPRGDLMRLRGSKHNTGEVLNMLLALGVKPSGHWQGAHATPIDAESVDGEIPLREDGHGNSANRYEYKFGITVNTLGERFYDEGENKHSYTYAKTGRAVLAQPGNLAYQIFDQKALKLFRQGSYVGATCYTADTIAELAPKIGLNPDVLAHTVETYNNAIRDDVPFNPGVLDGRSTRNLAPRKSNWAERIDEPPFHAYPITCGITFTFGGVAVNTRAQVLNTGNKPIKGLYASGDILGLFYHNYPGCSGQTRNVVFSRTAARTIAGLNA